MTISYEEALERVRTRFEPGWTHGTFCLDDRVITETDEFYVFAVGAREWLVDGDKEYEAVGGVTVVSKADGTVSSRPSAMIATDPTLRGEENPAPAIRV